MEAEGGMQQIDFPSTDWKIDRIENVKSNTRIFGDILTLENERVNENVLLELEGEGRLDAIWPNKGFVLVRDVQSKLDVRLKENSSGERFGFRIFLTSADQSTTITVSQKASQGYEFKGLDFHVSEADGDSLYWKRGSTVKINVPYSQEIEFTPIGGIDVSTSYLFSSDAADAFVWLKSDSVKVRLPAHFQEDEVFLGEDKGIYSEYLQSELSDFSNIKERITVPSGESAFRSEYEVRRRKLSYSLLLTNNRTGEEKIIKGKLIQIAPTGKYEVILME
ncbi:hypothetical protein DN752_13165 [Echinicola strongylocentroti]|uniref:Uncharacterized protein n=2 Tax=Echinicola strongylocentroti TaxID=1795355 RepID=A0A2Z4IKB9_9BACT|nr:hypothetical protein DN752_13165 [Echinicola strongylocentroti]